nr:MAG TPA: hypothetical protein [Caudoviricetes sp.]
MRFTRLLALRVDSTLDTKTPLYGVLRRVDASRFLDAILLIPTVLVGIRRG